MAASEVLPLEFEKHCWAEVDLDALAHNFKRIAAHAAPAKVCAVVKAGAYGHADGMVCQTLQAAGAQWFAVSCLAEALHLRAGGVTGHILILGHTDPAYAAQLIRHDLTQAVFSGAYAQALSENARAAGGRVKAHLKVDTGMGRIGFEAEQDLRQAVEEIAEVCQFPNLRCDGIFTHFSSADEYNEESIAYTRRQYELFMQTCDELQRLGVHFAIRHCCNSGGIVNYPEYHLDMVRAGILIYGLVPDKACEDKIDLKPAMQLHSVISMIKDVKAGAKLSYGRTFTADHDMRIATVPIGYADGYHRSLSNRGRMLVNGQFANIVGRVCMDQLMLDVTGIPDLSDGEQITIVGEENGKRITMEEIAAMTDTVHYEVMCVIGKRVPRVYRRNGKDIGVVDYIRHIVD